MQPCRRSSSAWRSAFRTCRLPRRVLEKRTEVENVGTHGTQQLVGALFDPGTPAADLVRAVAIADVVRIAVRDERREDRMEEIVRRLG